MRHIGLFGGTFNPIHCGHLLAAESVVSQLGLDELRFLPAAQSPFKSRPEISNLHRLSMLELATADYPKLNIDARELQKPGPSYTIDSVTQIVHENPGDQLYLMVGMDAWEAFERWKQWQKITELCHLVVLSRPGYSAPVLSDYWQKKQPGNIQALKSSTAGKLIFITVPASKAASNEIRRRIGLGKKVDENLPDPVVHYIKQHQLYRNTQNITTKSM